jgi:hypothetical protein
MNINKPTRVSDNAPINAVTTPVSSPHPASSLPPGVNQVDAIREKLVEMLEAPHAAVDKTTAAGSGKPNNK